MNTFSRSSTLQISKEYKEILAIAKKPLLSNTEELLLIYACCTLRTQNSLRSMVYLKIKILISSLEDEISCEPWEGGG